MATLDGATNPAPYGYLPNGHPRGDLSQVPRCGAKRRKRDSVCQAPAMANGRCRIHGGLSTGPKTAAGKERCRMSNWKHGRCSEKAKAGHREAMAQPSEVPAQYVPAREAPAAPESDPAPAPAPQVEQKGLKLYTAEDLAKLDPVGLVAELGQAMASIFWQGRAVLKWMGYAQHRADELLLGWIYHTGDAEAVIDLVDQARTAEVADPVGRIQATIDGADWS